MMEIRVHVPNPSWEFKSLVHRRDSEQSSPFLTLAELLGH